MPKGIWVVCTPEWITKYQACGATVRRPVLEPIPGSGFAAPDFRAIGHEHLMVVPETSGHLTPFEHESGEPA